jgi:large subunit ribosomal protein L25
MENFKELIMGGQDIALSLQERTVEGKAVKHLRKEGMTPAVIHDHGKPSRIVMAPYGDIWKVYQEAGKHHPLALTLGKDQYMAIIKDVDFDPKKHQMRHVVFNAIKQDEKVETEVPVILDGEIPAEKAGLMVITNLDHIDIEALPRDLIDELRVDASGLTEIGDKITVADIKVPHGVTILTELEHPIATIEETKAQISEEAETVEGEEAAEGGAGPAESTDEKPAEA